MLRIAHVFNVSVKKIDFAKKELKDSTIIKVIEHYDSKNLGHNNLEDPDAIASLMMAHRL